MPADDTARVLSTRTAVEEMLPEFLRAQRWFGGKAQPIRATEVLDIVPLDRAAYFFLVRVHYHDGPAETYSVPFIDAAEIPVPQRAALPPHLVLSNAGRDLLYDATRNQQFLEQLMVLIRANRCLRGGHGEVRGGHNAALDQLAPPATDLTPHLMRAEQSNSSVVYGDRLVLKIFRRLEQGINPDLEIGRFLTEKTSFRNVPLLAGYLEYADATGACSSMAILQNFVRNQGDAWEFTLQHAERYFDRVYNTASAPPPLPAHSPLALSAEAIPEQSRQTVGAYLDSAALLGQRTAELHLALSTETGDPAFDPEPYTGADQWSFCESALSLLQRNFRLLRHQQPNLASDVHVESRQVLAAESELERRFRSFELRTLTSLRTRIHGDYHLGQVLVSGDDFVIIDFEGEPARPLAERRRKRSPLQDVAGMLRSFHYAAYAPLLGVASRPASITAPESLGPWAYFWQMWVSAAFLRSYFRTADGATFLSRDPQEVAAILEAHLLEKAVYELGYELNNRPSWVRIPLGGIAQFL